MELGNSFWKSTSVQRIFIYLVLFNVLLVGTIFTVVFLHLQLHVSGDISRTVAYQQKFVHDNKSR